MTRRYLGRLFLFALPLVTLAFTSCDKEMSVYLDRNSNDALSVSIIDSFTVATSTYQLEYLPTAATKVLLVGNTDHPTSGSVKSTAYFEVGFQDYVPGIPTEAVFDSVNLILKPHRSNYYYGDTTVNNTFTVHKLTQRIQTQNITSGVLDRNAPFFVNGPTIFNKTNFTYETTPLGSKSFVPRIRTMDSLAIRLDQSFGNTLFDLMRTTDLQSINYNAFLDYLAGIALVPDDQNQAIIAFSDSIEVRFNYSYTNATGFKTNGYKSLTLGNPAHQFNNIEYDRTGTPFADLGTTKKELTLAESNGKLLVQSGTGAVTKIVLSSLEKLMREENTAINKVELIIETDSEITGLYPAPTRLMLMIADASGKPIMPLYSPYQRFNQPEVLLSTFIPGNFTGKKNTYTFDLIQYAKMITTDAFYNTSLLLSTETANASPSPTNQNQPPMVAPPNLFSSTNAAIIASDNNIPKIKLNIIYTKFQ